MSRTRCYRWAVGRATRRRERLFSPPEAGKRRLNWPLAYIRSARDNDYRASFARRNRRLINPRIVPRPPASLPALRAADRGVADALESVLSDNTRRVYQTQWKLFDEWCAEMGLHSLPAEPLTMARYLAVRAGSGASIATMRAPKLAFTHFKRRKRGRLQLNGTG